MTLLLLQGENNRFPYWDGLEQNYTILDALPQAKSTRFSLSPSISRVCSQSLCLSLSPPFHCHGILGLLFSFVMQGFAPH